MARIRTVKPELPQDAKLARVSREARYHFVLLWTVADDEGYFRANPRSLLGQLYPHDEKVTEVDVERMNEALERIGVLAFVQTDDGPIGYVVNWKRHQRIDRPSKSHLREVLASVSRESREGAAHGVLSPESRVLSPESLPAATAEAIESGDDIAVAASLGVAEPELTALYLSVCANKAVMEKWGEQIHPYTQGHAAALLDALRAVGVPPETARVSLYRQCRDSKAASAPRSINYFRAGIVEDWEAEQARAAMRAHGGAAPPREASARAVGGGRRGNSSSIPRTLSAVDQLLEEPA